VSPQRKRIGYRFLSAARASTRLRLACRDALYRLRGSPDGLPIPPAALHVLVSGNARLGVAEYFEVGRLCADTLETLLRRDGSSLGEVNALLDFGCGCARVLRHVRSRTPARLFGSDVNPAPIAWCRRSLPIGEFSVNGIEPPLAFASGSFDLVYAFSVFTHLPEPLQQPWMDELVRVLRPGGKILITTQGGAYAEELGPAERRRLDDDGILVHGAARPGSNECLVYHTAQYVESTLARGLELRQSESGKVIDRRRRLVGQDAYLLRRPMSLDVAARAAPS